ncbi:MAG: DUF1156 domain-containing protein [Armatimonadetes bacterium]|nr:DUF1156 domain-containing protein [Armatimonadota bacterium]
MIERRFDVPFVADLALREKQIQQNYRPVIAVHEWFARRPGTLFRALLLAEFCEADLRSAFYEPHNLAGITVCDPFMGGGTPLLEANRMGCDVIGTDINAMAHWIVREELDPVDLPEYRKASGEGRGVRNERWPSLSHHMHAMQLPWRVGEVLHPGEGCSMRRVRTRG